MTFLEFVIERFMGPPVHKVGERPYWHCPHHEDNHPSFSTMPHKTEYKDRAICFACGFRGDIFDVLREIFPDENYPRQLIRLEVLRQEFNRKSPRDFLKTSRTGDSAKPSKPEGNVGEAWADVWQDLRDEETSKKEFAFQILNKTAQRCKESNVCMEALVEYWADFETWKAESTLRHAAECKDWDCGNACRVARGLKPLTEEERQAIRIEEKEAERERMKKARKRIRIK